MGVDWPASSWFKSGRTGVVDLDRKRLLFTMKDMETPGEIEIFLENQKLWKKFEEMKRERGLGTPPDLES